MISDFKLISAIGLGLLSAEAIAAPPNYNVTNITNWNPQQLESLPFFKHYRPAIPQPYAPSDYHFAARTSSGLTVGSAWNVFVGPDQRGVLISSTGATIIDSFGDFYWWACCPFRSATFREANAFDVNWAGEVVGFANVPGSSQSSAEEPTRHPIIYTAAGGLVDLLPDGSQGRATCINNAGEIAGYNWGSGSIQTGFRRSPAGDFTPLDSMPPGYRPEPMRINASGVIIGMSIPGGWVSESGSTVFPLPKLFGMPLATVNDLNDAGWIVGASEVWDHTERYATLWEPQAGGDWVARDLTELLNAEGILLDRAIAINNDGCIIAAGHTDSDTPVYGTFLLTPTTNQSSSCVPDIGVHPQNVVDCSPSATFAVEVVNTNVPPTYQWRKDGADIAATANPSAVTSILVIASPTIDDIGNYDCLITNSCGSTLSNAAELLVCIGDLNCDGAVDLADLTALLAHFGSQANAAYADGDMDADADVDLADLTVLLARFGQMCH